MHVEPAELARRLDVSQSTVWKWTQGKRTPRPAYLAAIAEALQVPAHAFWQPIGTPVSSMGLAEPHPLALAPPDDRMTDPDEAFVQIQEAVAEMLKAENLPHAQADIARVSRIVERDMIATGRMRDFANGLELTLSEVASSLKRKWAEALHRR